MGAVADFEAQLQGRIVSPGTGSVQVSVPYQEPYAPDQFLLFVQMGAQSSLPIRKAKNGLNSFKYWTYTGQSGYVYTTVSDVGAPAPGSEFMDLTPYFKQHTTQRWIFKHGCVLLAGALITLVLMFVSNGFVPAWAIGPITTGLEMLNDKLKLVNPDIPWPAVGAQAPGAKK